MDNGTPPPHRQQERRFRSLVEKAPDGVVVLGPDLKVRYASPAAGRALGCDAGRLPGTALSRYLHPGEREWAEGSAASEPEGGAGRVPPELRIRRADGSYRLYEVRGIDLHGDPEGGDLALYLRDVTEERSLRDRLIYLSFHDSLTGLPNRALFMDRLEDALARADRHRRSVMVLFVDVDNFKTINDWFGHDVGDVLLRTIGNRLRSCVRPGDTVARLGGDEFAVLIESAANPAGMAPAIDRITQASRGPVVVRGHKLSVTVSVGAAASKPGRDVAGGVIRRADRAMYRAKRHGKGRSEMAGAPSRGPRPEGASVEGGLRAVLERGE